MRLQEQETKPKPTRLEQPECQYQKELRRLKFARSWVFKLISSMTPLTSLSTLVIKTLPKSLRSSRKNAWTSAECTSSPG